MSTNVNPPKFLRLKDVAPNFWELCRNAAITRFTTLVPQSTPTISDRADWDALTFGSSTSVILLAGKDVKIVFKAHYHSGKSAKSFGNNLSKNQIDDLYREYCNLVAGAVKQGLLAHRLVCGISLPIVLSGHTEAIFSDKIRPDRLIDCFDVRLQNFQFTVTVSADATSESVLEVMRTCAKEAIAKDDIDFL